MLVIAVTTWVWVCAIFALVALLVVAIARRA
jgi:hypothetical protein